MLCHGERQKSIWRWGHECTLPKSQPAFSSPISNMKDITLELGGGRGKVLSSPPVQTQPVKTRWLTSKARLVFRTPSGWCKPHVFDRWSFHQEYLPSLALPVCFLQTDCSVHPQAPCQPTAYPKHGSSGCRAPRHFSSFKGCNETFPSPRCAQ